MAENNGPLKQDVSDQPGMSGLDSFRHNSDRLHVFIAHRDEDQKPLSEIVKELNYYCNSRVKFYFSRDISPGTNWRDWIGHNIAQSNHLWLFYTDPSGRWEWPLFAAGLFTGLRQSERERTSLVCFHPQGVPIPSALAGFQGVELTTEGIQHFLINFYGERCLPKDNCINEPIAKDSVKIAQITRKLLELMEKRIQRYETTLYNKYIDLNFLFHGNMADEEEIRAGSISTDSYIEDIFARLSPPDTWFELIEGAKERIGSKEPRDDAALGSWAAWTRELQEAIKLASGDNAFQQPTTMFNGINDQSLYLPVLYNMRKAQRGIEGDARKAQARILFVRQRKQG